MSKLDRDGVAISYEIAGSGPVVLFTHGYAEAGAMFAPNVPALATDHTVITWDLRGHGDSDAPDEPAAYSVDLFVGDIGALLDTAGVDSAVLVGHSLGGYLSLDFRLRHPHRVSALVLIGTGPGFRRDDGRDKWNRMTERAAAATPDTGHAHVARQVLPQHDSLVLESLATISVPTLVVVGDRDSNFLASSQYMAGKIPGADLAVIAGAGHEPNRDQPAAFDALVREFLGVMTDRYGDVSVEFGHGFVASVTIHRPPDNYFDAALIAAIADAYEALDVDDRCRAIVLQSEGKHFCAGASLGGDVAGGVQGASTAGGHLYDQAVRMFSATTPVVAALQGAAIGGGLGLALAADFRVGTPNTRCSANFARLGFHHGFGLTVTLPAAIGQQRALELLYTGARVAGDDAHRMGLLDRLVAPDELDEAAHAFAREIAASGPLAVRSIRQTMRGDLVGQIRAATARERAEQDRLSATADFAEGVRATAERRVPDFQGR